jgi:hypothetical protein
MVPPEIVGTWAGTNGFRLMPHDRLREFPATASVTTAAGGHLTLVAYTWEHPDDGPQDGVLLLGSAGEGDGVTATWGDSWHQKPAPMPLSGTRSAAGSIDLEGSYGDGWTWRVLLEFGKTGDADELRMRMDNVIPASHASADLPAGPYPAMLLQARRS